MPPLPARLDMPPAGDAMQHAYDAYGAIHAPAAGSRTGHAGQVREGDVPWLWLGSRLYAPWQRGFISPDGASPFGTGGLNRYAYCSGDPINRIDPTGASWWEWLGTALGIVGAAVGIVATGGALLGAAAAAGSLSAAMASASTVTLAVAAVETTSIIAEIGSLATLASGDDGASGILGWIAFGTGLAAGASAGIGKLGSTAGKATKARIGDILLPSDLSIGLGYWRTTYELDAGRTIQVHTGKRIAKKHLGSRVTDGGRGNVDIKPAWTEHVNSQGGVNYVTDVAIDEMEANRMAYRFSRKEDDLPLVILTGVHGASNGGNWWRGRRALKEKRFVQSDLNNKNQIAANSGNTHEVHIIDIGGLDKEQFGNLMQARAHVVHSYCYSAADWQVIQHFRIRETNIYTI